MLPIQPLQKLKNAESEKSNNVATILLQSMEYKYKENENLIYTYITELMRTAILSGLCPLNEKERYFKELVTSRDNKYSAYNIYLQLQNLKEEFEIDFKEEFDYLTKFSEEYGFTLSIPKIFNDEFFIIREIEPSQEELVFGCGRAKTSCAGHDVKRTYFIDCDPICDPDIIADFCSSKFWNEIPSGRFSEIFFEGFLPLLNKFSLLEIFRLMKDKGKIRIPFAETLEVAAQVNETVFQNYFKSIGFSKIEIQSETFKSNFQNSQRKMLILYKE